MGNKHCILEKLQVFDKVPIFTKYSFERVITN